MTSNRRTAHLAAALLLAATALPAQSIFFGLRGSGSFPTGDFGGDQTSSNAALIQGAKTGFGYGLDAGISVGMLGFYAGFDQIKFDCETTTCKSDGKFTLSGATVGIKLAPQTTSLFHPYVKGGVTFNDLKGGYGGSSSNALTTDRVPGYEVGVGIDITLLGLLSLSPQARYIGQNFKPVIPGINSTNAAASQGVNYFTFDLGLSIHSPFSKPH